MDWVWHQYPSMYIGHLKNGEWWGTITKSVLRPGMFCWQIFDKSSQYNVRFGIENSVREAQSACKEVAESVIDDKEWWHSP